MERDNAMRGGAEDKRRRRRRENQTFILWNDDDKAKEDQKAVEEYTFGRRGGFENKFWSLPVDPPVDNSYSFECNNNALPKCLLLSKEEVKEWPIRRHLFLELLSSCPL